MVIWITGMSGAGKTTLCQAIWDKLKPGHPELVFLDGDIVRAAFDNDLGYREEDRVCQIKRMQRLAKMLSDQGMLVLVAALYSHPSLLEWNRNQIGGYFEVYLQASLAMLQGRDSKKIYSRATEGSLREVVGIDIPWHPPTKPDLVVEVDQVIPPHETAEGIIAAALQIQPSLTHFA